MPDGTRDRDDQGVSMTSAIPRATRPTRGRVVSGVSIGLARHLGLPTWLVRTAFVVLAFAGGIGVVLYAAFWAVLPLSIDGPDADPAAARAADTTRLLALAAVAVGVALLLTAAGVNVIGGALVPVILAVVGAALIWRQADEEQRDSWSAAASRAARQTAGTTAGAGRWRIAIGIGLVVLGLVALLASRTGPAEALQALATALLLLGGVAVVAFPWVYRRLREQGDQRRALIRSEERAEIAAHVHDSVLQTLTLIQRNADDPAEVARLARTEERALRSWLYTPVGDPDRTFAAAVQRDAADVEEAYGATIDVVAVGDAPLDARVAALLAAAREAMVNAARHGGGQVSVYAEATDDVAEVFVRDRGQGFDPAAVPDDRHGLRESVIGRMERNGGSATVRSTPGAGTEIVLRIPRHAEVAP
jgi:signal transduction histidine kinase